MFLPRKVKLMACIAPLYSFANMGLAGMPTTFSNDHSAVNGESEPVQDGQEFSQDRQTEIMVGFGARYDNFSHQTMPTLYYHNSHRWDLGLSAAYEDGDDNDPDIWWFGLQWNREHPIASQLDFTYGIDALYGNSSAMTGTENPYAVATTLGVSYKMCEERCVLYARAWPYAHERKNNGDSDNVAFTRATLGLAYYLS